MPQVVVLISVGLHSFLTIQESRESVFETPRQILERGVSTFDRAGSKHNKTIEGFTLTLRGPVES